MGPHWLIPVWGQYLVYGFVVAVLVLMFWFKR